MSPEFCTVVSMSIDIVHTIRTVDTIDTIDAIHRMCPIHVVCRHLVVAIVNFWGTTKWLWGWQ